MLFCTWGFTIQVENTQFHVTINVANFDQTMFATLSTILDAIIHFYLDLYLYLRHILQWYKRPPNFPFPRAFSHQSAFQYNWIGTSKFYWGQIYVSVAQLGTKILKPNFIFLNWIGILQTLFLFGSSLCDCGTIRYHSIETHEISKEACIPHSYQSIIPKLFFCLEHIIAIDLSSCLKN